MKHKIPFWILSFSSAILLAACIPSSADTSAIETDDSEHRVETQTAESSSPTPTLDYSKSVIFLEDLPLGFVVMPAENLDEMRSDPSADLYPAESVFGFMNTEQMEIILGFTSRVETSADQDRLDQLLPSFTNGYVRGVADVFESQLLRDVDEIPGSDGIGAISVGFTTISTYKGERLRFDVVGFRRNMLGAWIVVLYVDDEIPSITVVEIAGILDQRICELTQANE